MSKLKKTLWSNTIGRCLHPKPRGMPHGIHTVDSGLGFDTEVNKTVEELMQACQLSKIDPREFQSITARIRKCHLI